MRSELFQIEASEYAEYLKKKVFAAVLLALTAFFFLATGLVALIATLGALLKLVLPACLHAYSWQMVAFLFSFLFLLVISSLLAKLKHQPEKPFFTHSLAELKNDSIWLKNLTNQESDKS